MDPVVMAKFIGDGLRDKADQFNKLHTGTVIEVKGPDVLTLTVVDIYVYGPKRMRYKLYIAEEDGAERL